MIVNVMNAMGERQYIEKFIPLVIKKILHDEEILVHCDKKGQPGSRFYIHCRNIADAVLFLLKNGTIGEKYNVTGEIEVDNLELVEMIGEILEKPIKYKLIDFHSNRPGHDTRYSLDGDKIHQMGWRMPVGFKESLEKTVKWTIRPENLKWLEP